MSTQPHIMARADYIMPSMLPLDYTHRVSWFEHGHLYWRWCRSLSEALDWVRRVS